MNNIFIFILLKVILLLLILVIYFYRNFYLKKLSKPDIKNDIAIFDFIDTFYIRNIYKTVIGAFMYCFANFLLFLSLRFFYLGSITNLHYMDVQKYFTFSNIFFMLLYILFLYQTFKLIEELFLIEIIRLHLRFGAFYQNWIKKLDSFSNIIDTIYKSILSILIYTTYPLSKKNKDEWFETLERLKNDPDTPEGPADKSFRFWYDVSVRIYKLTLRFKIFLNMVIYLQTIIHSIVNYVNAFFKHLHYIILVIAFLYDLIYKEFFYSYYALFIYVCILFYLRLIRFVKSTYEPMDTFFYKYFYASPYFPYTQVYIQQLEDLANKKYLTKEEQEELSLFQHVGNKHLDLYSNYKEDISYLFDHLYKGEEIFVKPYFPYKNPFWELALRRFLVLLFTIFNLYYIIFVKNLTISLAFINISLSRYILLLILFALLVFCWNQNTYSGIAERGLYKDTILIGKKVYFYIFWFIIFIINVFMIYFLLKNNLFHNELSLNLGNIIIIKENISIAEKTIFFFEFFKYAWIETALIYKSYEFNLSTLTYVIERLQEVGLYRFVDNKTTLIEIKQRIAEIILATINLKNVDEELKLYILHESLNDDAPRWFRPLTQILAGLGIFYSLMNISSSITIAYKVYVYPALIVKQILKSLPGNMNLDNLYEYFFK